MEKIDWEAELPDGLVPPPVDMLDPAMLPLLAMVPFIAVQNINEGGGETDDRDQDMESDPVSDSEEAEDDMSVSHADMDESDASDTSFESGDENQEANLVPAFCLNDPKLVWPSDSESEAESIVSGNTEEQPCGHTVVSSPALSPDSFVTVERGRGTRGRNMARRSRPFFGKIILSTFHI